MNKPLVSVVIPIYNGKDHLGEAIQSVLDQTYDNLEIIVVDDVSPEDMSVVVNAFTDTRVNIYDMIKIEVPLQQGRLASMLHRERSSLSWTRTICFTKRNLRRM